MGEDAAMTPGDVDLDLSALSADLELLKTQAFSRMVVDAGTGKVLEHQRLNKDGEWVDVDA